MKTKILFSVIAVLMGINPLYATTMCLEEGYIAVVLDPTINGTSYKYDNTEGWWETEFEYGFLSGTSACLSSNYGKSFGGYVQNLQDNGSYVVGGERNGLHCWCKMTHPAASAWVFRHSYSSASACASACTFYCGRSAQGFSVLRSGFFGSLAD